MPLVGGGGAGNVAGSNPAGTGTSLNYIGNHAYATSGAFNAETSLQTVLNFTTGTQYVVGTLFYSGHVRTDGGGVTQGEISALQVSFDSQVVAIIKIATDGEAMPNNNQIEILIPPYTTVLCQDISDGGSTDKKGTVVFTGRVY